MTLSRSEIPDYHEKNEIISFRKEAKEATGCSHFTAFQCPTIIIDTNLKDGKLTNLSQIQKATYSNILTQASTWKDKWYLSLWDREK